MGLEARCREVLGRVMPRRRLGAGSAAVTGLGRRPMSGWGSRQLCGGCQHVGPGGQVLAVGHLGGLWPSASTQEPECGEVGVQGGLS